ncbi:MAG TPA: hypothetical protein DCZ01_07055 [Elusimicrobia bacterium]|nr:hypothetical protein [Elusimicrobiota bacterium]
MPPPSVTTREWLERDGFLVNARLSELGLRHGVTTRRLGNMKDAARRREAAAKLGLPEPMTLNQVHGTIVHRAVHSAPGLEGDGWILGPDDEGRSVAVYAADCVPLFLWSDGGKTAGVFHAGWRGTAAGMALHAATAMWKFLGIEPERLFAAAGPHIGPCCYKVGAEFENDFPASSFLRRGGDLFLDLAAETNRQLRSAGLRPERISTVAPCTASHPDDYFSFRRDKRDARMLALLSLEKWPS